MNERPRDTSLLLDDVIIVGQNISTVPETRSSLNNTAAMSCDYSTHSAADPGGFLLLSFT